ncbi:MAG: dockerin type I domain-containing protein [Haloarculaceae archaeon]
MSGDSGRRIRLVASLVALAVVLSVVGPVGTASAHLHPPEDGCPVRSTSTTTPGDVTLLHTTFESGSLAATGWTHQATEASATAGVSDATSQSGQYSAYHYGGAGALVSPELDAGGTSSVTVSYWVQKGALWFSEPPEAGAGEDLVVEYRDDGGDWVELDRIEDSVPACTEVSNTVALSDDARHDGLQLRFRQQGASTKTGDYWHVDDVSVTATPDPVATSNGHRTDAVDVGVASTSVTRNETTTLDVTVSDLDRGLSVYDLTVALENESVADVTGVDYPSTVSYTADSKPSGDNATVRVKAVDVGRAISLARFDRQVLGHVRIRGERYGTTRVTVDVVKVEDADRHESVVRHVTAGTVSVRPRPIDNGTAPRDPDGDGRFEDVDGDGIVDGNDVGALLAHVNDPAVQDAGSAYDYDGNGNVTVDDAMALENESVRLAGTDGG